MDAKNILVTTDFSSAASAAYAPAADLALRFNAAIHLVHVAETTSFYMRAEGFGAGLTRKDFVADIESRLREEAGHAALSSCSVTPYLVSDKNLIEGLRHFEVEHGVDLVVLATHGRSAIEYALLGSTAERIVRGVAAPVLTCRPPKPGAGFAPRKVLVPFDFSDNAKAVLETVRFLAQSYTPEFTFYFVVEPLYPIFSETAGHASYDFIRDTLRETPKLIRQKFEELKQEELAGVNVSLDMGEGVPTTEIVHRAKDGDFDLVVMSTHGWTGFRHFFLGSVAEGVVRRAPTSVLTVRSKHAS